MIGYDESQRGTEDDVLFLGQAEDCALVIVGPDERLCRGRGLAATTRSGPVKHASYRPSQPG